MRAKLQEAVRGQLASLAQDMSAAEAAEKKARAAAEQVVFRRGVITGMQQALQLLAEVEVSKDGQVRVPGSGVPEELPDQDGQEP